jgi:hypothetical protein
LYVLAGLAVNLFAQSIGGLLNMVLHHSLSIYRFRAALALSAAAVFAAGVVTTPQSASAQSTSTPVDERLDGPLDRPLDGPLDRPVASPTTQDLFERIDVPRGATVRDRPRPDYDPIGVPLGGFVAFPSITVSSEYNDNIFATDDNTEDDIITRLRPNVDLRSNWSRHLLGLTLGADLGFYADNTDENFQDFNVVGNGRYEAGMDVVALAVRAAF